MTYVLTAYISILSTVHIMNRQVFFRATWRLGWPDDLCWQAVINIKSLGKETCATRMYTDDRFLKSKGNATQQTSSLHIHRCSKSMNKWTSEPIQSVNLQFLGWAILGEWLDPDPPSQDNPSRGGTVDKSSVDSLRSRSCSWWKKSTWDV